MTLCNVFFTNPEPGTVAAVHRVAESYGMPLADVEIVTGSDVVLVVTVEEQYAQTFRMGMRIVGNPADS